MITNAINWLDLFIMALSVYRLSWMVAYEDGPLDVFLRIRVVAGAVETNQGYYMATTGMSKLLTCPLCLSVWFGAGATLLYFIAPWTIFLHLALALSGITVFLWSQSRK